MSDHRLAAEAALAEVSLEALHLRLARVELLLSELLVANVCVAPGGPNSMVTGFRATTPQVAQAVREILSIAAVLRGDVHPHHSTKF